MIFTYKVTKNISLLQLFQHFSYVELTLKKAVQGKERQQKTNLKKNARKAGNNELVTPPDGTSPDLWEYQAGTFSLMTGSGWQDYTSDATKEFEVVIDGQDVYISGLSYYFKDSWIKGNIENGKVIIPKGQIAGKDDFGAVYINGQDFDDESSDAAPIDIVFIYDENKIILLQPKSTYIQIKQSIIF